MEEDETTCGLVRRWHLARHRGGGAAAAGGGGTRREPQFENGEVRVWKSIIMPNQPLALHRHDHGRTIVALKGGTLDVVDASGATMQKMKWEIRQGLLARRRPAGTRSTAISTRARSRWK